MNFVQKAQDQKKDQYIFVHQGIIASAAHKQPVNAPTFIEAVIIHATTYIHVISSHKGQLCLRVLVGPIKWIVTAAQTQKIKYQQCN